MKFFRSAIILFVVAVIAGFSYWYFILKKSKQKEEAEKEAAYLFEKTDKGVARIILREKGKPQVELEKEVVVEKEEGEEEKRVDKWHILSPVETEGDATAVSGLVDILKESKKEEVVWESLEKKSEYGLDDPDLSIEFVYDGEQEIQGIDFGIENLTNTKVFAVVRGKSDIYAVPVSLRNSLRKSLLDLRDKTICPYSYEDIEGVTYVSFSDVFKIEREGEDWFFVPERIKASSTRIEIFTGSLHWGDFIDVTKERAEVGDLKKFGFGAPRMLINFSIRGGSNYLFMVGDYETENEARFYYATRSTDSMIFRVNEEFLSRLLKTRFELKDRSIFPAMNTDDVVEVKLEKDGITYSFRKEGEDWAFADTGETLWRDYKIDNIVRGIITAEYEEREPLKRGESGYEETGIDNPAYTVTFTLNDGRSPMVVQMTEKDKETNKTWLTPDSGNTAYYTSGYFLANWPESIDELLE